MHLFFNCQLKFINYSVDIISDELILNRNMSGLQFHTTFSNHQLISVHDCLKSMVLPWQPI